MNSASSGRQAAAFTLVEMLVVMGIIAILAALLLPAVEESQMRAKRIVCENRLHEIGIAFQSFAHDHNSKFPMQVDGREGGSLEFAQNGYLVNGPFYFEFRHFQPLADVLETPKPLICPTDTRVPAKNFATLQNSNVSYFIGVDAEYSQPMSILSGDGNLVTRHATIVHGTVGEKLKWTAQLHQYKGNVLFADGHVEEWGSGRANSLAVQEDFVLPTVGDDIPPSHPYQPASTAVATQPANSSHSNSASALPAASQPVGADEHETAVPQAMSANRAGAPADESRPIETGETAAVVKETSIATNTSETNVSKLDDDRSVASRLNEQTANILRPILFGAYFLFLILFLLYAAYRIWRWMQERERKRSKTPSKD